MCVINLIMSYMKCPTNVIFPNSISCNNLLFPPASEFIFVSVQLVSSAIPALCRYNQPSFVQTIYSSPLQVLFTSILTRLFVLGYLFCQRYCFHFYWMSDVCSILDRLFSYLLWILPSFLLQLHPSLFCIWNSRIKKTWPKQTVFWPVRSATILWQETDDVYFS